MILRPFFIVKEHFEIASRGMVLLPGVLPDFDGTASIGDDILIRTPNGQDVETRIDGIDLCTPNPRQIAPILLREVRKSDVRIGSEVFLVQPGDA